MKSPTPKAQFLRNEKAAEALRNLTESVGFQDALQAAFAEYCWHLPGGNNPAQAWDSNSRRQGAREFIDILMGLGDPIRPLSKSKVGQLEPEGQ